MGAWGYEPKESDSALDLMGAFDDYVNVALSKLFDVKVRKPQDKYLTQLRRDADRIGSRTESVRAQAWRARFDRAGVVQVLLEKGFPLPRAVVTQAYQDLQAIVDNEEILSSFGWRNDGDAKERITRLAHAMHALLAKSPCVPTIYPNRGWPYLDRVSPRARKRQRRPAKNVKRKRSRRK